MGETTVQSAMQLVTVYGMQVVGAVAILVIGRVAAGIMGSVARKAMERAQADLALVKFVTSLVRVAVLVFAGAAVADTGRNMAADFSDANVPNGHNAQAIDRPGRLQVQPGLQFAARTGTETFDEAQVSGLDPCEAGEEHENGYE